MGTLALALGLGGCGFAAVRRWLRRGSRATGRRSGILFTGTGSSSAQPQLRCVLGRQGEDLACQACPVALRNGRRDPNWRNNVGLLIRFLEDGQWRHVQIDCGKTFRDSVIMWYTEHQALMSCDSCSVLTTPRGSCRAFPYLFPGNKSSKEGLLRLSRAWCNCSDDCDIECQENQSKSLPNEVPRFVATIEWKEVPEDTSPFDVFGLTVYALPVMHGADYVSFGYGFGPKGSRVVYISDYTEILPRSQKLLEQWSDEGIAVMILDMLFPSSQKSSAHATLDQSLDLVRRYRPRKAFFVGMTHFREHHDMNRELRQLWHSKGLDVQMAQDGQFVPLDLQ